MALRWSIVDIEDKYSFLSFSVRDELNEEVFDAPIVEIVFDCGNSFSNECGDSVWSVVRSERLISWKVDRSIVRFLE